jgi:hypothetical protein
MDSTVLQNIDQSELCGMLSPLDNISGCYTGFVILNEMKNKTVFITES